MSLTQTNKDMKMNTATITTNTDQKLTLSWPDLFTIMKKDNGGRWYATHPSAVAYITENGYRSPSRAWPHSHSKPLLTRKFAKWLMINDSDLAAQFGLTN